MKIFSLTDKGMSRHENQDNYWSAIAMVDDTETCVACICDGMGGLKNGGEASKLVIQGVKDCAKSSFSINDFKTVIEESNNKIYSMSNGSKSSLMGTTCSLLRLSEGKYEILHVGDSRVYIIRDGVANRLTKDHSAVVALNIDKKKEPEKWLKYRSKLTRCVGAKDTVSLDTYKGSYLEGDTFFLCSDGVWHLFEDVPLTNDYISDLSNLFKECIESGELDNLTAIVVKV